MDYLAYTYNTIIIYLDGFFASYWHYILVVFLIAGYFYIAPEQAKAILRDMFLNVEKLALETGEEKMNMAIEEAYKILPWYVKIIFSEARLKAMAQTLYDTARNRLPDNQEDGEGYPAGEQP